MRVAAVIEGYTSMMGLANVAMSRQTARLMGLANDSQLGSLMVRIKNPADAERVRNELNALANGQYRAWTKDELHDSIVEGMNSQGPIFVAVMFMTVIGAIIGVVITWQTLARRHPRQHQGIRQPARAWRFDGQPAARGDGAVALGRRVRRRPVRRHDGWDLAALAGANNVPHGL